MSLTKHIVLQIMGNITFVVKSNIIQGKCKKLPLLKADIWSEVNASERKGETNQVEKFLYCYSYFFLCTFQKNTSDTSLPLAPLSQHVVKTCSSLSVGKLQFQTPNHRTNYKSESFLLRRLHIRTKKTV
jgi:hypothetical protein